MTEITCCKNIGIMEAVSDDTMEEVRGKQCYLHGHHLSHYCRQRWALARKVTACTAIELVDEDDSTLSNLRSGHQVHSWGRNCGWALSSLTSSLSDGEPGVSLGMSSSLPLSTRVRSKYLALRSESCFLSSCIEDRKVLESEHNGSQFPASCWLSVILRSSTMSVRTQIQLLYWLR